MWSSSSVPSDHVFSHLSVIPSITPQHRPPLHSSIPTFSPSLLFASTFARRFTPNSLPFTSGMFISPPHLRCRLLLSAGSSLHPFLSLSACVKWKLSQRPDVAIETCHSNHSPSCVSPSRWQGLGVSTSLLCSSLSGASFHWTLPCKGKRCLFLLSHFHVTEEVNDAWLKTAVVNRGQLRWNKFIILLTHRREWETKDRKPDSLKSLKTTETRTNNPTCCMWLLQVSPTRVLVQRKSQIKKLLVLIPGLSCWNKSWAKWNGEWLVVKPSLLSSSTSFHLENCNNTFPQRATQWKSG